MLFVVVPTVENEIIRLRPWREREARFYVEARDDAVFRWTSERRHLTVAEAAESIRSAETRQDAICFAMADPSTDEPLGNLPVALRKGTAVLAYWVAPAARGRDIASEALRLVTEWLFDVGISTSAELEIHPGNAASRRVAEKAGFCECGFRKSKQPFAEDAGHVIVYRRPRQPGPAATEAFGQRRAARPC